MAAAAPALQRAARHNPLATAGVVMVIVFVAFAVFAPLLAPYNPAEIHLPARLMSPSTSHWFGTDELGRDILSRIIYGARISMLVGISVVAASLALGLIFGCDRRILRWHSRSLLQHRRDECVPVVSRHSAGDRVRGVPRAGCVEPDSRAVDRWMGRLRAPGTRPSAGDAKSANTSKRPGRWAHLTCACSRDTSCRT